MPFPTHPGATTLVETIFRTFQREFQDRHDIQIYWNDEIPGVTMVLHIELLRDGEPVPDRRCHRHLQVSVDPLLVSFDAHAAGIEQWVYTTIYELTENPANQ